MAKSKDEKESTWEVTFDLSEAINPNGIKDDQIVRFVKSKDGITGFKITPKGSECTTTKDRVEDMATQKALMWVQWMTILTGIYLECKQTAITATTTTDKDQRKKSKIGIKSMEKLTDTADTELTILLQFASDAKKSQTDKDVTGFISNIWQAIQGDKTEQNTSNILSAETAEGIRCIQQMLVQNSNIEQIKLQQQKRITERKVSRDAVDRIQDKILTRIRTDNNGAIVKASHGNKRMITDYGNSAIKEIIWFVIKKMGVVPSDTDDYAEYITTAADPDQPKSTSHTLGERDLAKYPFLPDAGDYLKDKKFTLEKLGTDQDMAHVVENAFKRVKARVQKEPYKPKKTVGDAALPNEVFSFLLAIILLKLCDSQSMIRRFALEEAIHAEKHLENDLTRKKKYELKNDEKYELATKIFNDLFSIQITREDNYLVIPVHKYIQRSIHFHEREWKLVNRHVWAGGVHLTPHETVRLIRSELVLHINKKITDAKTPKMISGFEGYVQKLIQISKQFVVKTIDTGEYPPCIKHAIEVLEKGENLSHSGRFMLATFMLSKGQSIKQIAPMFKNAPDYNEKTTNYQLNHLAGSAGTKYSCPSCEKIKMQDLCFAIPACDNIISPIQFGKIVKE